MFERQSLEESWELFLSTEGVNWSTDGLVMLALYSFVVQVVISSFEDEQKIDFPCSCVSLDHGVSLFSSGVLG